ncbi:MAG: rhodanese-like domain-containing protein [candidate division FCPU426 bacterium]
MIPKPWQVPATVIAVMVAWAGGGCAPQVGETPRYDLKPVITASEYLSRVESGTAPFLLDVREPEELQGPLGALASAHNIPLGQISERMEEIPRDREVVVVCRSGSRSHSAIQWLQSQGYTRLRNLEGGMLAIREAGKK